MNVSTEYSQGILTVGLTGELDHHTAKKTMQEIERAMDRYLPRKCELDLSGLSFMDSSGIAVIIRARKRMLETNGKIWLIRPFAQPMRVLEASGVDRLINIKSMESGGVR